MKTFILSLFVLGVSLTVGDTLLAYEMSSPHQSLNTLTLDSDEVESKEYVTSNEKRVEQWPWPGPWWPRSRWRRPIVSCANCHWGGLPPPIYNPIPPPIWFPFPFYITLFVTEDDLRRLEQYNRGDRGHNPREYDPRYEDDHWSERRTPPRSTPPYPRDGYPDERFTPRMDDPSNPGPFSQADFRLISEAIFDGANGYCDYIHQQERRNQRGRFERRQFDGIPLLTAVCMDDIDEVRYLLDRGYYPDQSWERTGESALILAAKTENMRSVRALVRSGADGCATDRLGHTASDWAMQSGHQRVANYLNVRFRCR